jgi:hypothetical protein
MSVLKMSEGKCISPNRERLLAYAGLVEETRQALGRDREHNAARRETGADTLFL